jgi:hypothetical protein
MKTNLKFLFAFLMIISTMMGCREEEQTVIRPVIADKKLKMTRSQFNTKRTLTRFEVNGVNTASNYQDLGFSFSFDGKVQVLDSLQTVTRNGTFSISADSLVFTLAMSGPTDRFTDLNGNYHLYLNNGNTWDFTTTNSPFRRLVFTFSK